MQQGSPRKCRSCQELRQKRRTASATTPNWRSAAAVRNPESGGRRRASLSPSHAWRPLSPRPCRCTSLAVDPDIPFDRRLRRLRRDCAAGQFTNADYLHRMASEELLDRLDLVKRDFRDALDLGRSEEHTSELQSLMRISYAVFCL